MPSRPKILLLGDSLTQLSFSASMGGWGAHLQDVYQRRADVIGRGMSGYNTDWYLQYIRQDKILNQDNVVLVTIFFGANDSSDAKLNPHHHVPPERFRSNLQELIDLCRNQFGNDIPIIVVGCPPVHHEQRLAYQKERYGAEGATGELERNMTLSQQYSSAAQQVAEKNNLPCLNLWREMQEGKDDIGCYFYDGLHFSREGNEFVGQALVESINKHYPQMAITPCCVTGQWANSASQCVSLEQSGPYHDEIDHIDAEAAFGKSE